MKHICLLQTLAAAVLAASSVGQAAACTAPAVTAAHVANVTRDAGTNLYHLAITVTNSGSAQPNNTLQSVDVSYARQKLDALSVPPLQAGGTYTANYTFRRSSDAGDGTTRLHLLLDMRQPACTSSSPFTVTF
jgi:CARDB